MKQAFCCIECKPSKKENMNGDNSYEVRQRFLPKYTFTQLFIKDIIERYSIRYLGGQ